MAEEKTITIYGKLLAIQSELNAPKNQKNTFGGYNYRSCEDILEAVKPLLKKHNVTLILSDSMKETNNRVYVEATARLIDIDTQEFVFNTAYAREEETKKGMDGSQVTGASSSYARKYALNGLFCIDDNKDSDKTNVEEETHASEQAYVLKKGIQKDFGTITKEQKAQLLKLIPNVEGYLDFIGVPDLDSLSYAQAQATINMKAKKDNA